MRRLLIFAAAFAAAAAFSVLTMPSALPVLAAAVLAAGISLLPPLRRERRLRALRICLLGVSVGLAWCAGYRALALGSAARYDGAEMQIDALVLETPEAGKYGAAAPVELRLDGRRLRCTLYLREQEPELRPGDRVSCRVKLKLAPGSVSPDENLYSRTQGVWFLLSARSAAEIAPAAHVGPRFWPARFSGRLRTRLAEVFDANACGFLTALLTGDRSGLSRQTRNELSIAGIYHTVAVSGMHVSILLGVIVLLCGGRRRLAAMIGIPVIVFFVLMTGASASAVRAGVMQTLLLLAPLIRREYDAPTSLGAAALALMLENPWTLMDIGFQLSFASVAGILLFARRLYQPLMEKKWFRKLYYGPAAVHKLAMSMASAFCCSIASMVFSLPLAAYHFRTVSLIAPLCNMLTLWVVSILFTAGMGVALLALVWKGLALGPAWLLGWLVRYVLGTARLLSKLPCAALYPENSYILAWCVFFYIALLLHIFLPQRPRLCVSVSCFAVTLCLSLLMAYAQLHLPYFTFTALDVGQGQCLLYQRGTWTAVIDCGGGDPWSAGENAARYLQSFGEYRIEALVVTHYDADHAGGVAQLLERQRVECLFLPDSGDETGLKNEILSKAKERGCAVYLVREDLSVRFPGGELQIFAPLSDKSSNDSGISVLASAGEYDMLITGDMTEKTEQLLLEREDIPQTELLVAGHHGAAGSTGYALLSRLRPQTVLISVGEDNFYGHPSPQTLARIEAAGAAVYRTDQCGTITIRGPIYGKTNGTDPG